MVRVAQADLAGEIRSSFNRQAGTAGILVAECRRGEQLAFSFKATAAGI
jgi:hypothetical protein